MDMDTDTDQRVKVKVLIIGGITGYLGQLLCIGLSREQGVEIHASSSTSSQSQSPPTTAKTIHLDLLDEASVTAVLSEGSYDVVVNTAAVSQPAVCETSSTAAAINVPTHLVAALENTNTLLIHISTDQVYDGSSRDSTESTAPNPINAYGRSKLQAEACIQEAASLSYVILRSSIIVGPEVEGVERPLFVQFIRDRLLAKQPTDYVTDEFRSPIFAQDICRIIAWFVRQRAAHPDTTFRELYCMGGLERLSRHDMAHAVATALGIDASAASDLIVATSSAAMDRPYVSPRDISMDSSALARRIGIQCKPFRGALLKEILQL